MKIEKLKLKDISIDESQPRKNFENIQELRHSILKEGLLEPLKVMKKNNKYVLVDGERRYRALTKLNEKDEFYDKVDCIIIKTKEVFITQLATDLHKNKLNPFEEAQAFKKLLNGGWEIVDLKTRLGIKRCQITDRIKLLGLRDETKELIKNGDVGHSIISGIDFNKFKECEDKILKRINNEPYFGSSKNRKRNIIKKIIMEETGKPSELLNNVIKSIEDFNFFLSDSIDKIKKLDFEENYLKDYLERPLKNIQKIIKQKKSDLEKVLVTKKHLDITDGKIKVLITSYGASTDLSKQMIKKEKDETPQSNSSEEDLE